MPRIEELAARLGLDLPVELLAPALVHRSWCAENPGHPSNERLEFLGDAVLGLIVAEHVYKLYPDLDEGSLTEIRKTVVSSVALAEMAQELGLGDHLLLGRGEEQSGGREKPSILADAMEAVIGATYLSAGAAPARQLVLDMMGERLATAISEGADYKSRLQELTARLFEMPPSYEVDATGPDHARTFSVVASIAGVHYGQGEGRSKKQAEQAAARAAVEALSRGSDQTTRETHYGRAT